MPNGPTQFSKQILKLATGIAVFGGLFIGITSVAAHHSSAVFDHSKTMTIKGIVVELRWVNPHVSLSINGTAKEGEEPALWIMEMPSPGNLVRAGWRRDAVKPGERVEAKFNPLRDAEKRGGALKCLLVIDRGEILVVNFCEQERTPDWQWITSHLWSWLIAIGCLHDCDQWRHTYQGP
jgi:hypothetical protein